MDSNPDHHNNIKQAIQSPSSSRKRSRASSEDEDRAMEEKRLKARERQRRKRERDRSGRDKSGSSTMSVTQFPQNDTDPSQQISVYGPSAEHLPNGHPHGQAGDLGGLSPEEAAKRERVRAAARERQRKHRAAVKAKRMAELGMAIVNAGGGVEQAAVGYILNEHGQYEPVMEDPNSAHHPHVGHEPPFPVPQPHATPGQTFASTLLLSFSVAPLLKQHMLRTLHMTDEELASFEPIIAAAWDHWDYERAMHSAAASANAASEHNAASTSYLPPHPPPHPHPHPHMYPSSDFRARFHRPLVAPFPSSAAQILRTEGSAAGHPANANGSSTSGSYAERRDHEDGDSENDREREGGRSTPPVPAEESIDPNLEASGMSDVRGDRKGELPQVQPQEQGEPQPLPPAEIEKQEQDQNQNQMKQE